MIRTIYNLRLETNFDYLKFKHVEKKILANEIQSESVSEPEISCIWNHDSVY